jgi:hypothetical protein
MILGDPSRFAAKVELAPEPGGAWLFGRLGLVVAGREVGDFAEGTSLRDVLFLLDELDRYGGDRWSPSLGPLTAEMAFARLNEVMFGEPDEQDVETSLREQWARHRFLPAVDVMRDWKGFVLDDGAGRERVLLSSAPYVEVHETWLERGEVDRVLCAVRRVLTTWLEAHHEGPAGPRLR